MFAGRSFSIMVEWITIKETAHKSEDLAQCSNKTRCILSNWIRWKIGKRNV